MKTETPLFDAARTRVLVTRAGDREVATSTSFAALLNSHRRAFQHGPFLRSRIPALGNCGVILSFFFPGFSGRRAGSHSRPLRHPPVHHIRPCTGCRSRPACVTPRAGLHGVLAGATFARVPCRADAGRILDAVYRSAVLLPRANAYAGERAIRHANMPHCHSPSIRGRRTDERRPLCAVRFAGIQSAPGSRGRSVSGGDRNADGDLYAPARCPASASISGSRRCCAR